MPSTALFLSSSTATSVSPTRDNFNVQLRPPLYFEKNSEPRIAVASASMWNSFPNISAAQGNNIIYYTDTLGTPQKYSITLTDGAYEVPDLNLAVSNGLVANGHASTLISFTAIPSTGRVTISLDRAGYQINFPAGTPYYRLGITLNSSFPSGALSTGAVTYYGQSGANISPLNSVYVSCSLASGQSIVSGASGSVVAQIIPNVGAGSLIAYQPSFPLYIDCKRLENCSIDNINLQLTSDSGGVVDTGGEDWSITIIVETR